MKSSMNIITNHLGEVAEREEAVESYKRKKELEASLAEISSKEETVKEEICSPPISSQESSVNTDHLSTVVEYEERATRNRMR